MLGRIVLVFVASGLVGDTVVWQQCVSGKPCRGCSFSRKGKGGSRLVGRVEAEAKGATLPYLALSPEAEAETEGKAG